MASIMKKKAEVRGKHTRLPGEHNFMRELYSLEADSVTTILDSDSITTDLSCPQAEIGDDPQDEHSPETTKGDGPQDEHSPEMIKGDGPQKSKLETGDGPQGAQEESPSTTVLTPVAFQNAEIHKKTEEESPGTTVLNFADVNLKGPSPLTQGPSPVTEGPSPLTQGTSPVAKEGPSPLTEGPSPVSQGPSPVSQGPSPIAEEGPSPLTEGPSPVSKTQFFVKVKKSGEVFKIENEKTSVGKSKYADIQIKNTQTVSRIHINFHLQDGMLFVEDNMSTNGTFINNEKLTGGSRREVFPDDVIRISDEVLLISTNEGRG